MCKVGGWPMRPSYGAATFCTIAPARGPTGSALFTDGVCPGVLGHLADDAGDREDYETALDLVRHQLALQPDDLFVANV